VAGFAKKFELTHPVLVGGEAKAENPENLFTKALPRARISNNVSDR